MFVLPAIIIPLIFCLAVHRLYQVPRRLYLGELQLPVNGRPLLFAATLAAYFLLLSYTVALAIALGQVLLAANNRLHEYLALLGYIAAYPLVYIGAAWVFYYGLRKTPKTHV
jgi:hypothetical protein